MKPFRTSLSARIVSMGIAVALIGGGLCAMTGTPAKFAVPALLIFSIGAGIVGLLLGIGEHAYSVTLLAILLPLLLWPYSMFMVWVVESAPRYGIGLVAAGVVVLGATLLAGVGAPARDPGARAAPPVHAA